MSIKKKLIIMYLVIVLIPMVLVIVGVSMLNKPVLERIMGGIIEVEKEMAAASLLPILTDLQQHHEAQPESLKQVTFANAFIESHQKVMSMRVYTQDREVTSADKYHLWPNVTAADTHTAHFKFDVDSETLSVELQYLPLNMNLTGEDIQSVVDTRIKAAILGYFIAHTLFLLIVGKYFIKLFRELKVVAQKVENKDYDFELNIYREDEIGDTFRAFDKMRTAIWQYENSQREFVANISHDLKTPITAIKGYIAALQDGIAKDDPIRFEKYLTIMNKNAIHLDHLVDDLFLLAKLDVDQVAFDFQPVTFKTYIEYIFEDLQMTYEDALTFHLQMDASVTSACMMDPHKIRRVILNLVDNGLKHMDKQKKHMTFMVKELEEAFQLTVVDNGKGIPREDLTKIFNRFYRVESNRHTDLGGTGLGLSISQQIMEKHQGKLFATSALGCYTAITIELPKL